MNLVVIIWIVLSVLVTGYWLWELRRRSNTLRILFHANRRWALSEVERIEAQVLAWAKQVRKFEETIDQHERAAGGFWTTAQGHLLRVRDMSDQHLKNALRYIEERNLPRSTKLEQEQERREMGKKIQAQVVIEIAAKKKTDAKRHR